MSSIITQAESLLRDVSNNEATPIEKVEKIERLLIKMDAYITDLERGLNG